LDTARRPEADGHEAGDLPLAGLKILDATAWWAGPSATQLLAALGADVVHVESIQVIDGMRPAAALPFASLDEWWERSCFFLSINTNKRGITLDLGSERGRELFLGLVAWADVMVENYTPRVFENWDLDWERLKQVNPRLVMCRMPAFGLDGPWHDRVGFAQTMEQVSGLSWTTGYRDGPPMMPNGPCDPLGGMHAAFAILTALAQRDMTGVGCMIEAPLVESALNLAAEEVLEFSAFGRVGERLGNRSRERAPQGVYRCEGDEQWIAVSVEDEQWPALVELLGAPEWAQDPALSTVAGRFDAHDRLDEHLADWFRARTRDDAAARLQAAGVAAAPVIDNRDVVTQPVSEARGFAEWCDHPVVGRIPVTTLPFRWSGIDRWIRFPAPTLGQHNHEVLSSILGLDEAEIEQLEDQGVIGTRPAGL
jgi:crotonobetainyl-CoA:carnitine CoA-transferase CaiB-like acyl-CoA transferase